MARGSMAKEGGALVGALQVPSLLQTLAALQAQEQRWCSKVTRVRAQVEKLDARLAAVAEKLREVSAPHIDICHELDDKLHGVFATLLAPESGLRGRARAQIKRLYEELQCNAFLSDRMDIDCLDAPAFFDFPDMPPPCGALPPAHKGRQKQASRDLFRKLAETLHPDKSHDNETPAQRALREEAMKAASVAYQQGDLGRLLSIEKMWLSGRPAATVTDVDDAQARCEAIKARIADLIEQEKALRLELRHLRMEPENDLLRDIARAGEAAVFANVAQQLVDDAQELRRAIRRGQDFAAKRISLGDFLMSFPQAEEDEDLTMEDLQAFFDMHARAPARPPRKRNPAGKAKRKR
ncbi:MAG: hypothetical protein SF187_00590 [Deltaproteobacteria bacterium]|nr:hypothetical protein [Deltaproteobacteria bacterium]